MKFLSENADMGTWRFNVATNTITWALGNLTVCDPTLNVITVIIKSGKYTIQPILSTLTYDPNLTNSTQIIVVNAQTKEDEQTNTIRMQKTGIPLNYLMVGIDDFKWFRSAKKEIIPSFLFLFRGQKSKQNPHKIYDLMYKKP